MRSTTRIKTKPFRRILKFDFSFTSKSPYPKDIPLAKNTFRIARQNLDASRLLYSHNFIPEAVFFLQQSVEKGCKAFGYYCGFIDEDVGLKKISHHSAKVYSRALFEYEKILNEAKKIEEQNQALRFINRLDIPVFSNIDTKIQAALEIHKSIDTPQSPLNIEDKIVDLTSAIIDFSEQMNKERDQFDTDEYCQKVTEKYYQELDQREEELLIKFRRRFRHNFRVRIRLKDAFKNFKKSTKDEIMSGFTNIFYRLYICKGLLLLGCITQPHESSTRYASTKSTFNPLEYYSKESSIVQNFSILATICEDNLNTLEKIFSFDESQEAVS
jgi:HEPN domain-containing protein